MILVFRCRADLMRKLRSSPLPFEISVLGHYPGILEDIKQLQKEDVLHILHFDQPQMSMVVHF